MVSIPELKQLKNYYKEKLEYLYHLLKNETYYCEDEKKYKHTLYKQEARELEKSIGEISREIYEIEKPKMNLKVERKYTPNRVTFKKKVSKTPKRKTRSLSPTMSEKIENVRSSFKPKKSKSKSKRVNSEPPKSRSKSRSRSRSKSRSKK